MESLLVRAAASVLSRRGQSASLLVLIFHRVLPEPDPLLPSEPDAKGFAAHMELLRSAFKVLPLVEAVRRLRAGTLPSRSACITFDDGYANNCDVAMPILLAKGLPATVFIASGFLNGGRMFNDTVIETVRRARASLDLRELGFDPINLSSSQSRINAIGTLLDRLKALEPEERLRRAGQIADTIGVSLPTSLMLTTEQVRKLHCSGIEIGAHTIDHPILTSIDCDSARRQIVESKRMLEEIICAPVRSFAYPNGRPLRDYKSQHVSMVGAAGFEVAVSTAWGAATRTSVALQIPRVAAWDTTPLRVGLRLSKAYGQRRYPIVPTSQYSG